MFSGIVEKTARVLAVTQAADFRRLSLALDWPDLALGQSVAVNGCCLTVAQINGASAGFDVVKETLDRTNLAGLQIGDQVNVERSLKAADRIDGHFVQGHIDGLAVLTDAHHDRDQSRLTLHAPSQLARYLIPKGSVALDGVSLTIAAIRGEIFEVAIIPTTLRLTTLGSRRPGWSFNLEADILSKTIVTWLERQKAG